jgi:cytochrome P450
MSQESSAALAPSRQLPPGPRGLPYLGQAFNFARDPLGFLSGISRRYGDISYFTLGRNRVFYVARAEYIWEVLVTQRSKFEISTMRLRLEPVLGTGLLTSRGELHARQRRLMQPVFRKSRIEAYADIIVRYAQRTRDHWREDVEIDATEEMMRLAMAIAAQALFSHDIEDDSEGVSRNLGTMLDFFRRLMSPMLQISLKLPLPSTLQLRRALRDMDRVIHRMVEQRRANPTDDDDLLSLLMKAKDDETNAYMTEKQLRDEICTLLLAGHETTANVLGWTLYLLGQHPEVDARAYTEVRSVLGTRPQLEPPDADRLLYTKMVITEGMRLYPPAWFIGRTALDDVQLGSYTIPRGASVLMSQYVTQRDGRYFEDPEAFRPERWAGSLMERLPRGAFFPFSAGDRHCIGEGFAWLEALLALGTLLQRWRLELVPGQDIRPSPSITLRPNTGIRMIVRRRGTDAA